MDWTGLLFEIYSILMFLVAAVIPFVMIVVILALTIKVSMLILRPFRKKPKKK